MSKTRASDLLSRPRPESGNHDYRAHIARKLVWLAREANYAAITFEQMPAVGMAQAQRNERDLLMALARAVINENNVGFSVTLTDKKSAPKGYWFAGAFTEKSSAEKVAADLGKSAKVKPFVFIEE